MGRRITTAAIAAAAVLSVGAGTAMAAVPSQTLSNGSKLSAQQTTKFHQSLQKAVTAAPNAGTAQPLNHGVQSECTVPENNTTGYTNFFTKDTTNYFEFQGFVLVGDCSADLTKPQTTATAGDHPGGKGMIPFPGTYKTYNEACAITYKGHTFYGDANSIVYKDGEFVETCIASVVAG